MSIPEDEPPAVDALAGAVRRETASGVCTYLERAYALDDDAWGEALTAFAAIEDGELARLAPGDEELDGIAPAELLFLDIETTGLGGAGAIAFLIAAARLEGEWFVLRQYLAESPAEEAAALDALLDDCALHDDPVLATYNGRRFDAPMLDQRATMHRSRAGFEGLRHLDLLYPARRVYGRALPSCRLATIESEVLGITRPSADVDGAEVPTWYFRYLRTGDMRYVGPIASHNQIDVLSLAVLTGHLGALLAGRRPASGSEALGLARLGGADAESWLRRALELLPRSHERDEALWWQGLLHRRAGRRDLAMPHWRELAAGRGLSAIDGLVEIAKHYEHDLADFEGALGVVREALDRAGAAHRDALLHRRARLERRAERRIRTAASVPA